MALALAFAPILPGFAFGDPPDPAFAAHATHDADAAGHAGHADHHGSAADDGESPCAQHDGCHGQCCATCVQCFTGTTALVTAHGDARPVQTPTVRTLLDSLLVSFLNRPPSAG